MANKISKTDFVFLTPGLGRYKVTYTSPNTGKSWSIHIDDMTLIDVTKNAETPKVRDLEALRNLCKRA